MSQYIVLPQAEDGTGRVNINGEVYTVGQQIFLHAEQGDIAVGAGLVELVPGTEDMTDEASEESLPAEPEVDPETVDADDEEDVAAPDPDMDDEDVDADDEDHEEEEAVDED